MTSLTLKPAQVEIQLHPGATYTKTIDIENHGSLPVSFQTSVEKWSPQGNNGEVVYTPNSPSGISFSLSNSDIQLGETIFIPAGGKTQLVLKMTAAANLSPQDQYFTFFLSQKPQDQPNMPGVQNLIKIGSHFLISIDSNETPKLSTSIDDFRTSSIFHDSFKPVQFKAQISNDSLHFFQTDGTITISKNNTVIEKMTLFPHNVLSQHQREISCLSKENESTSCIISPPLWPGVYSATITHNSPPSSSTIHFFVFPYYLTFGILLIVVISLLIQYIKRYLASK